MVSMPNNTQMQNYLLSNLDLIFIVCYIIGTRIFFAWYVSLKSRNDSESYFFAGKSLGWPLIGLSFYVSNMSGSSFIGIPASAYADGIGVYNYEWIPSFILIFFIFFLLPVFYKSNIHTAPEYLELRFNRACRYIFSTFLILANIFIDAASALYAGAMVLKVIQPSIPIWATIYASSFLAGTYICYGGLQAVVLNDTLQAGLIFIGGLFLLWASYSKISSWESVKEVVPDEALHLIKPIGDPTMPWPGVIGGVLIIGIYFWCMNQFVMQRTLGARSIREARLGSLFAAFLKLPNIFILVLPGIFARVLYPELSNPDLVFPTLVFDLLPSGIRGLMLASITAAILSSLEAIYNSASTLITYDFVSAYKTNLDDKTLVKVGRIATIACMVLSALWAPHIADFPSLWQYLQSILAYTTPTIVAVFLSGIFFKRVSGRSACTVLVLGLGSGIVFWVANEIYGLFDIHYLYACGIWFSASFCLLIALSYIQITSIERDISKYVFNVRDLDEDQSEIIPFFADYRFISLILFIVTCFFVGWWW